MRTLAVVPTFQNARTLPAVVRSLESQGFEVIVVDDGSTDGTGAFLEEWQAADRGRRVVVNLPRNSGKGGALAAGLAAAKERGAGRAVTVDADGQHLAADARRVADAAGDGLVLGARDESSPDYPRRSLFGRRLWALGVRSLTGLGASDPVCGLRRYPLAAGIRCRTNRFGWEVEWIVRAAWSGIAVREVPVSTVYLSQERRVSHWAWHDWPRNACAWAELAAERVILLRGPWQPPAAAPLGRADRSSRRLLAVGCAVAGAIGGASCCAGTAGLAASVAATGFLGSRLHVPAPLAAACAAVAWAAARAL